MKNNWVKEQVTTIMNIGKKITDEEFNKQLVDHCEYLQDITAERPTSSIMPLLASQGIHEGDTPTDKSQQIVMFLADFGKTEKHEYMTEIGRYLFKKEEGFIPQTFFLISEAWMKEVQTNSQAEKEYKEGKTVSEFEDRQEVVIIAGATTDGRTNGAMIKIGRTTDNKIMLYKDYKLTPFKAGSPETIEPFLLIETYKGFMLEYLKAHSK